MSGDKYGRDLDQDGFKFGRACRLYVEGDKRAAYKELISIIDQYDSLEVRRKTAFDIHNALAGLVVRAMPESPNAFQLVDIDGEPYEVNEDSSDDLKAILWVCRFVTAYANKDRDTQIALFNLDRSPFDEDLCLWTLFEFAITGSQTTIKEN